MNQHDGIVLYSQTRVISEKLAMDRHMHCQLTWPTMIQFITLSDDNMFWRSMCHAWRNFLSPEFGSSNENRKCDYFCRYANCVQQVKGRPPCRNPARSVQTFWQDTDMWQKCAIALVPQYRSFPRVKTVQVKKWRCSLNLSNGLPHMHSSVATFKQMAKYWQSIAQIRNHAEINEIPCSIAERTPLISYTNPAELTNVVDSDVVGNSYWYSCDGVFRWVGAHIGYEICNTKT